ncbi:MAG: pyrimidine 5'-nucleotidase [Anaerolineales bacterium]|jgi:putative hydrolase of the HAD superfamily
MPIEVLFLDLDGTLYPHGSGLWDLIAERMEIYMHQVLDIPEDIIPSLRQAYFKKYGTTLGGLLANHSVDPEDFLSFVHDVPVGEYIKPDEDLGEILTKLPQIKWILTNSDKNHSNRVLTALGVADLFTGILGVSDLDFHNKPDPYVFEKALETAGNPSPESCLFADDLPQNLLPAREMGFVTVLVGDGEKNDAAMYHIQEIIDLPKVLAS